MASTTAEFQRLFLMTNSFETGGSERQFAALARAFRTSSFRPCIACIARRGAFLEGFEEVLEFPVNGNLYGPGSMRARWRLAKYLRDSDTAVAHAFDFYTNLLLIPAARVARVPVVIGSQRQLGDLLSPAKSRAQLSAFRWCDRVICNSRAAAERLIKQGLPQAQIVIIGNGLDPFAFEPALPALARGASIFRVGMIARMNARSKNHHEFLRAAALLHRRCRATEFVLAGDGPLRSDLEREAAELGIQDCTHFLGDRRDIPAILASLDISVLPSASESLSNAILESLAAGIPVVASQVGGNPELVSDERGILVPSAEPEGLAAAIELLLRQPAKRFELGRNGRKFAESNFSVEAMRKSHEELYTELLEVKLSRSRAWSHGDEKRSRPSRIRVAIIAASPRYIGGQSVQAGLLLSNWRSDPDVEAFLIPIDPVFPLGLRWIESIPFFRTLVRQPFYLAALWRGLSDADIAHIFSASYWSFLIAPVPASLLARIRGKKTILHYHSGEARDHLQRFRTAGSLMAKADRLVVPSRYLVEVFREFSLGAEVVPNIVDLAQFRFRDRKPLRPHLVCTRGFHAYYRIDLVVRAFALVQSEFPFAQLDLVGQGPEERRIRKLVSQLNLKNVNFAGVASRQQIGGFYDAADIFINASALDNMPVSVLEAFASGTPVASTAPEGMRYVVEHEHTGLLSEPGDAGTLAANVIRLLRDPGLSSGLASNAYEQSKRYRWNCVREQWLEIYRSLAGRTCGVTQIPMNAALTT